MWTEPSEGGDAQLENDLRALVAPLSELEPAETLRSVRIARRLGRAVGERFARCLSCLAARNLPLRTNPRAYFTYLVMPARDHVSLDWLTLEEWEKAFETGSALRDPRVQAFCTGLSEYALEVAAGIAGKRNLLATFLEVQPDQIAAHGTDSGRHVIFGYRNERFLLIPAESPLITPRVEAETPQTSAPTCAAFRAPAPEPLALDSVVFLRHRIVRWYAPPHGTDGPSIG